jgi:hypothetical protein
MTLTAPERSAYPPAVEQLLPQARRLANDGTPSLRRLMREFRIGKEKARDLQAALTPAAPAHPGPRPRRRPLRPRRQPATHIVIHRPLEPSVPAVAAPVTPEAGIVAEPVTVDLAAAPVPVPKPLTAAVADPSTPTVPTRRRPVRVWPVALLALPAFVAIWSGWVGLGELTGFGVVHPLPGIVDGFRLNTAITLPVGVEAYAAYALRVWLSGAVPPRARRFARTSAIASLILGALGQVAYHLLAAAGVTGAPWWITTLVACFPVSVLGMGAALAHLIREPE